MPLPNAISWRLNQIIGVHESIRRLEEQVSSLTNETTRLRQVTAGHQLLEQQVRFLVVENLRLNQLILELIYLNQLERASTGAQTKASFDYQWRELPEGKWMPSNPEFLSETPKLLLERTQLPSNWFAGKRILDAGCGSGRWTYGFLKLGAQVTAVDQSQGGLAQVRKLTEGLNGLTLLQADLLELNLEPEGFDLVWCFGVPHHTANPILTMKNITRCVAPGGYFFVMLYGYPQAIGGFSEKASYEEWRQKFLPLSFEQKVEILKQHYPPELVHGYFDAVSPTINDLFTFEWIQAFLQREGFDSIRRTLDHPNHHVVARKLSTALA